MSLLSKAQMREFIAANDFHSPEDIQRALKALFAETLQTMLDAELDTTSATRNTPPAPNPPPIGATAGTRSRSPPSMARWRSRCL